MTEQQWWRGAVIYQIYPRSFSDTDTDGDLPRPALRRAFFTHRLADQNL